MRRALTAALFALAALPALFALPAWSQGAQSADSYTRDPMILIDHGVICHITRDGSRPAPDTVMGEINLIDQTRDMDVTTRVVPAKIGISFGIKFAVQPVAGDRDVRVIVTHPPMGPDGVTRESWITALSAGHGSLNLFTFEFPYELVTGDWTMAIEHEGVLLMEQQFQVVPELAAPGVVAACFGQDFVS